MKKFMISLAVMVGSVTGTFAQAGGGEPLGAGGGIYHTLVLLVALLVGLVVILAGIFTIAQADFYLATRETAINTRQDSTVGPKYGGLKLASVISKIIGVLLILFGLILVIAGFNAPF